MPIFLLPHKNNTVIEMLPSGNLILPRSLFIMQPTTKGFSVHIPYEHNPGTDTLKMYGSLTKQMVL